MLKILGIAALGALSATVLLDQAPTNSAPASPAAGHTIHVTAPHVMGDRVIDPMHHWCKVISPEPIIECLMFDSPDSTARLTGIEYILAKSITRTEVPLEEWNRNWHDHAVEIEAGVVKVHGMSDADAKGVAETVAGTDGIVFYLWSPDQPVPTEADVMIAQAVSHKVLSAEEYAQSAAPAMEKSEP